MDRTPSVETIIASTLVSGKAGTGQVAPSLAASWRMTLTAILNSLGVNASNCTGSASG